MIWFIVVPLAFTLVGLIVTLALRRWGITDYTHYEKGPKS